MESLETTYMMTEDSESTESADTYASPLSLLLIGLGLGVVSVIIAMIGSSVVFTTPGDAPASATAVMLASFVFGMASICGFIALVLLITGGVRWGMYGFNGTPGQRADDQTVQLLRSLDENMRISETARRIAYREHDLDLLRRTIEEDIESADYDGAMVLVTELAETYGRREEAEDYRDQIEESRMAEVDRKVSEAVARLDDVLDRKDYDLAGQVAARIQRLFPDSARTQNLRRRVVHAREQYKLELERSFLEAAQRDDVEKAMEILLELDKYLTEQEAQPLREVAKGVIGKKRDNLGVQFKMAVHDHEWLLAVQTGEQIISDFPNTRMAEEVRGMIDLLRERAAGQSAAQT